LLLYGIEIVTCHLNCFLNYLIARPFGAQLL
jgi:hypothetical protein